MAFARSAALASYVATVALVSPQPVAATSVADVRYLSALLPLCIGLSSLVICLSVQSRKFMAVPLAILVFGTNVLNTPFLPARWTCRSAEYVEELWIAQHVHRPSRSVDSAKRRQRGEYLGVAG